MHKKRASQVMKSNLFIISPSGWRAIAISFGFGVLFAFFDLELLATLAFVAGAFFLFIYRNPERELQADAQQSIVSPVDGKVTKVEALEELSQFSYMIEIDSSYTDVTVLRAPVDATLNYKSVTNGSRVGRFSPLFEKLNESAALFFLDANNKLIKVEHHLKQSVAPLEITLKEDDKVAKAARYGVMVYGVTRLYLESDAQINVKVGDKLKAAESSLAYFS